MFRVTNAAIISQPATKRTFMSGCPNHGSGKKAFNKTLTAIAAR